MDGQNERILDAFLFSVSLDDHFIRQDPDLTSQCSQTVDRRQDIFRQGNLPLPSGDPDPAFFLAECRQDQCPVQLAF